MAAVYYNSSVREQYANQEVSLENTTNAKVSQWIDAKKTDLTYTGRTGTGQFQSYKINCNVSITQIKNNLVETQKQNTMILCAIGVLGVVFIILGCRVVSPMPSLALGLGGGILASIGMIGATEEFVGNDWNSWHWENFQKKSFSELVDEYGLERLVVQTTPKELGAKFHAMPIEEQEAFILENSKQENATSAFALFMTNIVAIGMIEIPRGK